MQTTFGNVLHDLPHDGSVEIIKFLHAYGGLEIERIIIQRTSQRTRLLVW